MLRRRLLLLLAVPAQRAANAMRANRPPSHMAPEPGSLLEAEALVSSGFPVGRHVAGLAPVLVGVERKPGAFIGSHQDRPDWQVIVPTPFRHGGAELHAFSPTAGGSDVGGGEGVGRDLQGWKIKLGEWFSQVKAPLTELGRRRETAAAIETFAIDKRGIFVRVKVPGDWVSFMSADSLRLFYRDPPRGKAIFRAESKDAESDAFAIKVMDAQEPANRNEVRMLRRLRTSGNVVPYLASEEFPKEMFVLTLAADETLSDVLTRRFTTGAGPMPLNESLPILIDVLRGVVDLNAQGIVHYALGEEHVLLKDGRPWLTGLGSSAILTASGVFDGPADIYDQDFADVSFDIRPSMLARLPPETAAGWPNAASNNVWQVGTIFARMALGYVPMSKVVAAHDPGLLEVEHYTPELAKHVQDVVRRGFSVWADDGFRMLKDGDVQDLLAGMLETSAEKRWSAEGALEQALAVARRRGVEVPPERGPPKTPIIWGGDWE